jgi:predicted aspartyl protease
MHNVMRCYLKIAALGVLLPGAAQAADCTALKIVDRIQMVRTTSGADEDLLPVLINGQPQKFLFDTGGERTQISRAAATALNLPIMQGNFEMMDVTGKVSRDAASAQAFQLGRMRGKDVSMPINPGLQGRAFDGIVALEVLRTSDIDVDFGTDTMNMFSTDHCDGAVVYWKAPAVAVVPIVWHGYHMSIPVTLDGHEVRAYIDTGASNTALFMDTAKGVYNLTMGDADTPETGKLNGDEMLKTYGHVFKSLSFGSITVNNPHINIIPKAMGRDLSRAQLVSSRAKTEKDLIDVPDLIIGMNVLRKLHIYIAMKENKMYITDASAPAAQPAQ